MPEIPPCYPVLLGYGGLVSAHGIVVALRRLSIIDNCQYLAMLSGLGNLVPFVRRLERRIGSSRLIREIDRVSTQAVSRALRILL